MAFYSVPFRMEYQCDLLGILLYETFVSPPLFIYFSVVCISMCSWMSILYFGLQSNTTLFCRLKCSSFGWQELFPLAPVPLCHSSVSSFICFWALIYFWHFKLTSHSKLILCFSCPSPKDSHFSKEPRFLFLGDGLETQIWVLYAHAKGVSFCLDPLSWQSNMSVYTAVYLHVLPTHVCIHF